MSEKVVLASGKITDEEVNGGKAFSKLNVIGLPNASKMVVFNGVMTAAAIGFSPMVFGFKNEVKPGETIKNVARTYSKTAVIDKGNDKYICAKNVTIELISTVSAIGPTNQTFGIPSIKQEIEFTVTADEKDVTPEMSFEGACQTALLENW